MLNTEHILVTSHLLFQIPILFFLNLCLLEVCLWLDKNKNTVTCKLPALVRRKKTAWGFGSDLSQTILLTKYWAGSKLYTLYRLHPADYNLQTTYYILHSTPYILHSTYYTLHTTLCTPCTLYRLHSTLYIPHSTYYTLQTTLYRLHSTDYNL